MKWGHPSDREGVLTLWLACALEHLHCQQNFGGRQTFPPPELGCKICFANCLSIFAPNLSLLLPTSQQCQIWIQDLFSDLLWTWKLSLKRVRSFVNQALLLCNGPVNVARLGDDFVAKIADQSSQVLGQVVHGRVLDVIVIVVIVVFSLSLGSISCWLVIFCFQFLMSLWRPWCVKVLL